MKIFKSSIISLDYIANLKLLLKGNICFNKNLSYNLIIHNENASLKNYNYSQSKIIIKEIKEILSHVEKIASEQDFSIIKIKFKNHYIKNIYTRNHVSAYTLFDLLVFFCSIYTILNTRIHMF